MEKVILDVDQKGQGAFYIMEGEEQVGEMVVRISEKELTVYHTEVPPQAEGKGYAKKLLQAMVDHARAAHLKVIPLCPYVHTQFLRHPEAFSDLWSNDAKGST